MANSGNGIGSSPGTRQRSNIVAGTYAADSDHTMVLWEIDHLGLSRFTGIFKGISGQLEIDPDRINLAKVHVVIPISEVFTVSAKVTSHLLSAGKDGKPDFFGPDPLAATFTSTQVDIGEDMKGSVTGELFLNGIRRSIVLSVDFVGTGINPMGGKQTVGFSAAGVLARSDFGLGFAVPMVSDETLLRIEAAFELN